MNAFFMSMMNYKIENITKIFKSPNGDELVVFENLTHNINGGEITSIVGASGSGKSTLLHIVGTIDKPTSGKLNYKDDKVDLDLVSAKPKELNLFRNLKLGFIFQFHHLLPEFTAIENVMIPAKIAGKNDKIAKNKAMELLHFVGLEDRVDHKPKKMSGGEQQRVAIARAIINEPKLLIADEPTGNLDEKNSDIVSDLFHKINDKTGTAILLATHSTKFAAIANKRYELTNKKLNQLS